MSLVSRYRDTSNKRAPCGFEWYNNAGIVQYMQPWDVLRYQLGRERSTLAMLAMLHVLS
jgi:hypothetical protein